MENPISNQVTASATYATALDFTNKPNYKHLIVQVTGAAEAIFTFDGGSTVAFRVKANGSVAMDNFPCKGVLQVKDDGTGVVVDVNAW